jgi:hypothetical protein
MSVKATCIGNTVVAYIAGKMYQKVCATLEERVALYEKLLNGDDEQDKEELISLFVTIVTDKERQLEIEFQEAKKEAKKQEDILDFMKHVKENGHDLFEVNEHSLYIKGFNISTPALLIRELKTAHETNNVERVNGLLNFWKLCAMNPDPRARYDLFKFLVNHNLTITPSGHFVAYRTVDIKEQGDSELETFITQEYLKVKRWKKSPSNYNVYKLSDDTYRSTKKLLLEDGVTAKHLGNLAEMYENIGALSGNIYTDAHTGKMLIKMGEPVKMDRTKVDPDITNACSYGLHLGNESFMRNNMGHFGRVGIVCLVNPRNVTAVPEYDSGKMRTCEYLPVAVAELDDNGKIVPVAIDVFDYEYAQHTQEELEMMKNLNSFELEEYKKHQFIAPEIDCKLINTIYESVTLSIDEANKKIQNRVVKL